MEAARGGGEESAIGTAATTAAGVDVGAHGYAKYLETMVDESGHIVRAPAGMRLPIPGTMGAASLDGWRLTQAANAKILSQGGRWLGFASAGVDGVLAFVDYQDGRYLDSGLDATSAVAGIGLFAMEGSSAPVSIPILVMAKTVLPLNRLDAALGCAGADTNAPFGQPF